MRVDSLENRLRELGRIRFDEKDCDPALEVGELVEPFDRHDYEIVGELAAQRARDGEAQVGGR